MSPPEGAKAPTPSDGIERRRAENLWRVPSTGDRRPRRVLQAPLPAPARAAQPLPDPSDWTFELIERYHDVIRQTAERFGLDTYPNQLEIITA